MKILWHRVTHRLSSKRFAKNNNKQSDTHAIQSPQTIKCVDVLKVENRQCIFIEL